MNYKAHLLLCVYATHEGIQKLQLLAVGVSYSTCHLTLAIWGISKDTSRSTKTNM